MKKFIIIILLFLIFSFASGQKVKLEAGFGIGTYTMTDLKEMNGSILKNLPVEAKITDNFPSRPYYNAGLIYMVSRIFSFGITGSYNTTGSRISYKDFSGELTYDNILSSYSPGIQAEFTLADKMLRLSEETNISYSFTKFKMNEKVFGNTDLTRFNSNSIQIEPRLKISYLIKKFELCAKVGYLIDFSGGNKMNGDKNLILKNKLTGEDIKNNWSGFRISISMGFVFN